MTLPEPVTPPSEATCKSSDPSDIMLTREQMEDLHRQLFASVIALRKLLGYPKLIPLKPKKPKHFH